MAHTILERPHPHVVCARVYGALELDDMIASPDYGLGEGIPIWLVCDMTDLKAGVPAGFIEGAKHSLYVHPNLQHLGLYLPNAAMQLVTRMVVRLTGINRLTMYESYAAARDDALARAQAAAEVIG